MSVGALPSVGYAANESSLIVAIDRRCAAATGARHARRNEISAALPLDEHSAFRDRLVIFHRCSRPQDISRRARCSSLIIHTRVCANVSLSAGDVLFISSTTETRAERARAESRQDNGGINFYNTRPYIHRERALCIFLLCIRAQSLGRVAKACQ